MRALILGGTKESRDVAQRLNDMGWYTTTSLAGRVSNPALPVGEVRIGGFGGPAGLTQWILSHGIEVMIDATHPFAERISLSAAEAARATGIPLVALHRPLWTPGDRDQWIRVPDFASAAAQAAQNFHHIFLTIGRQNLHYFAHDVHNIYVIRTVEPPRPPLPHRYRLIHSRGPFKVADEKKIMRDNQIDCLITKNSGGSMTTAKLQAARELGIKVLMIERPALPAIAHQCSSTEEVIALLEDARFA
ncbi:cobalt-precorrin-6A reductase [Corynebacterium sp. ES2794-CONJ1]|uniref:cobalt-precorrin-6A reductase n=1 Tax=unclassified Corynebacterium TaxID=2624378 RepID=UPI0021686F96|nr:MULTISPECIES: cobalt-precorrin-6A reductase [unclassified Corynebacterium]MCS4489352.1 cobalt-precorrin-6A reductase [Corynebacterium sp. ES2775-CONJ]MCS4491165.1 cobalt-precorrin-6A reductase [Corynebacterium sp. ES2715-CONJ3]MCS4530954.1 cobalt-precorrin-6A reductase [Corynebacterium sp. ES2730-CONJ]MCU9518321.1 cobalt-precorrin-6A reductase [Corynebacterium sp. ES2794-CONJ1]